MSLYDLADIESRNAINRRAWAGLAKDKATPKVAKPSPLQAMQALGRLKVGQMNATESAYGDTLEARKAAGEIAWYKFEGIKFRLADDTFYSPDYAVMLSTGQMEIHEVKGFWQDDAKVKIKVAASLYPFSFIAVQKLPKKDGGGWKVVEF